MGASGSQELKVDFHSARRSSGPLVVAVVGATGQIGYALLPMIAAGDMFGHSQSLVLQCLDLNQTVVRERMKAIEMEMWDGNFELLHRVNFTTDDAAAFRNADYAIFLGAFPTEGKEKKQTMEMNSIIFRTLGNAIARNAKRDCKIVVVGHPSCANALLCAHHAPSMPKENITAVTCLDQKRASWQLAQRAGVPIGDVRNVIVWGSASRAPDADHVEITGHPVRQVLQSPEDGQWLTDGLVSSTRKRGWRVSEARQASAALSTAQAIVSHGRALHCGTKPGELISMGVWSDGNEYGISDGLIFSMPVHCPGRGKYQIQTGLRLSKRSRHTIKEAEAELLQERALILSVLDRHRQVQVPVGKLVEV